MKNKKKIFFYVHFLFCIACKSGTDNSTNDVAVQKINIEQNRHKGKYDLESLIEDYKIIPLNCPKLIANINKVKFTKDKMYVQDEKSIALLEFTLDGNFIKQIGNIGAGPGEYLSVDDFDIDDKTGHVFILSLEKMSLIEYDKTGKYYSASKLPVFASGFLLVENGFLFFLNSNPNELSGTCDLMVFDRKLNFKQRLLCRDKLSDFIASMSGVLMKNEKGVVVTKMLEGNIYYFEKDSLRHKYFIDFGKNALPKEYQTTFAAYNKHCFNYMYLAKPILENDRYLSFYYLSKSKIIWFIWDKKRHTAFDDNINFEYRGFAGAIAGFNIIGLKDDYFLARIDADAIDQYEFNKSNSSKILKEIKKVNLKNHVLVWFKLKLP